MNFIDAMNLCFAHPAGDDVIAVTRPDVPWYVYLGGTSFAGVPCYLWKATDDTGDNGYSYTPSQDDINAEDWIILEFQTKNIY